MKHSIMAVALLLCTLAAAAALAGGGAGESSEIRSLRRKVAKLEKQVVDLDRVTEGLAKLLTATRKDAVAAGKSLKAVDSRIDAKALRLAEWFDTYHKREGYSQFHRVEIKRVK